MTRGAEGIGLYHREMSLGFVPAYQSAPIPYCTASIQIPNSGSTPFLIELPYVSNWFAFINEGTGTVRLGFSENGINGTENNNWVPIEPGLEFSAFAKIKDIYLLSNCATDDATGSFFAGVTGIKRVNLPGNWSGSAGIG